MACWESSMFPVFCVLCCLALPVWRRMCLCGSLHAVSLLTEGKGSGAVQSLFPWFCLCFQRAFKSFDDVWRLWEVRCMQLGTLNVDCTPPLSGGEATRFPASFSFWL